MSGLRNHPIVAAAESRDEKEFFGQGWSHYGVAFQHTKDGMVYYLLVLNTPNKIQVDWSVSRVGAEVGDPEDFLFPLTPEESQDLAAELGLPIEDWIREALAACARDVTPDVVARSGEVVDPAVFHSGRAGDDI